ncbi:MAG: DNA polymerase III subunit alpha [Spirochaetales bacterium]|nr:DNA polymerase III subunit alpha [Spirochaetales bacterium]
MSDQPQVSYVPLHCHTDFSLLDGSASVSRLVAKAKNLGMPAVAITDHGNLFGALKFWKEAKAAGIKPIIGCELYVAPGSRFSREKEENEHRYYHLILLAKNDQGYHNLSLLSSAGYTEGFYYKPRVDWELLTKHHEGLICLSACLAGEIPRLILAGKLDDAKRRAREFQELYGPENYYLELQDHGIDEQRQVNPVLIALGRELGIPLVATNDSHYIDPEDADAQDTLLCIGTGKKKTDLKRMTFGSGEFYVKSPDEMARLFAHVPEALANTLKIAEACSMEMKLPGPLLPKFEVPGDFAQNGQKQVDEDLERLRPLLKTPEAGERLNLAVTQYFVWLSNNGLKKRYPTLTPEIIHRQDYELSVIISMDFVGYFLIVADFIGWAKDHDIPVGPGRGSGAGSIVAYALRITDIEPLKYKLLFERFLNPERISMPDFDVDFCMDRRQEVVDYVTRRYGEDKVGQIITFGTLKAKAAIKDVARVLGFSFAESNLLSSLVPKDPKISLKTLITEPLDSKYVENGWQENHDKLLSFYRQGGKYQELFDTALRLEGLSRHTSTHAAGVVIGKSSLTDFVPLYRDPKTGQITTQFTMDQLEECGLVKMDFLGLATLTVVRNTLKLIERKGIHLNEEDIPENDEKTFHMLCEGKSSSVFQFESSGMQQTLRLAKPSNIEDLIALNALFRPGPMEEIPNFIQGKQNPNSIKWLHPDLKDCLKDTYGVIVYQEQVMEVAQIIGGYSLGGADLLRRVMGKKKAHEMEKQEAIFLEGAAKKGYDRETAKRIFDYLVPFANYGFNKSHAAAYSVLAYKTAYLKAHYPAEYMAANLTNEMHNQEKMASYIHEAKTLGISILPPHVNTSERLFTVVDNNIIFGLQGVKNIGAGAVEEILSARVKGGPFTNFLDFLERIDLKAVNKRVLETGIQCGVFDGLGSNRATLYHNLDKMLDWVTRRKEESAFGQTGLFDAEPNSLPILELTPFPEWAAKELLDFEKTNLGLYVSGHPLDPWYEQWKQTSTVNLADPQPTSKDTTDQVLGLLRNVSIKFSKSGKKMCSAVLEDFRGSIPILLFQKAFEQAEPYLVNDSILGFTGRIEIRDEEKLTLSVRSVLPPENLKLVRSLTVHVRVPEKSWVDEEIEQIRDFFLEMPGTSPLILHIPDSSSETVIRCPPQLHVADTHAALERYKTQAWAAAVWRD